MPDPKSPRNGLQPSSVDPTDLISRAETGFPEPIEPTVVIRRDDLRRGSSTSDKTVRMPPVGARPRAITEREPQPPRRTPTPAYVPPDRPPAGPGFWQRLTAGGGGAARRPTAPFDPRARDPHPPAGLSPTAKGALFALAGVLLAALAVLGGIAVVRYMWSPAVTTTTVDRSQNDPPAGLATPTAPPPVVLAPTTWTLTIYPPEHGSIVVGNQILCGVAGTLCSAEIADGQPIVLGQEPEKGWLFLRFTGECGEHGEVTMTTARKCSATFQKDSGSAAPPPPSPTGPRKAQAPNPGIAGDTRKPTTPPVAPPPAVQTPPAAPPLDGPHPPPGRVVIPDPATPPPVPDEEYSKKAIGLLVVNYCGARESRNPAAMKQIYPTVDEKKLRDQYRDMDWIKCTPGAALPFDLTSAVQNNVAKVQFVMKEKLKSKAGWAPKDAEFDVTLVVSRKSMATDWLIVRADVAPKPKD